MSSSSTRVKALARPWRVCLAGLALAVFALGLPQACAGEVAKRPSKVCPPAKGPVHQDPKSVPRPTCHKGGHDHAHAKTYDFKRHYAWHCPMPWQRGPEACGWRQPYRREREQACRRDRYVAERHWLGRTAESRRPWHYGWHGHAGWCRRHWWHSDVESLVGPSFGEPWAPRPVAHGPAIPRGYMPGGPADAGGGMADGTAAATGAAGRLNVPVRDMAAPDAPLKLTNRKTGATLVVGEPFRMRGTGAPYRIVASQSGRYFARAERPGRDGEPGATPHRKPSEAPDAGSRQIIWKAVPVGGGFWKLVNSESGEYLEDRGAGGALKESPLREGASEQQWRVEPTPD